MFYVFSCVALYFVLKTGFVLVLLFLLVVVLWLCFNYISIWLKKKSFFLIAFVSQIPHTETQPNGTETKCNRSVRHPFLTNQFHCSKIQTEIFGLVQKLHSTPTETMNDLWHTLFMEIRNSSCNVASNSHSFIPRKYFFQMWSVYL